MGEKILSMIGEFERCYRAVQSRDVRFEGWFYVGVTSTGIYCRPSCPAVTPKHPNFRFYKSAASAQANGFRACKRCRPGSPERNVRADPAGRAIRLIANGVVDREGVSGLAEGWKPWRAYAAQYLWASLEDAGMVEERPRKRGVVA